MSVKRLVGTFCVLAMLSGSVVAEAGAAVSAKATRCGTYSEMGFRYEVRRSGPATCKFAAQIMRSFIRFDAPWRTSGSGSRSGQVSTNRRYPGWRCVSGAGGASCTKGSRTASYNLLES